MIKEEVKEMIDTIICSNKETPITGDNLNYILNSILELIQ